MPRRPRSPCTFPRCPALVDRPGRCARHRREADRIQKAGKPWRQAVYGGDWEETRARVLAEEPVCKACGRAPSTEVDHIVPVGPPRHGHPRARSNLQGLCGSCHRSKTARERR